MAQTNRLARFVMMGRVNQGRFKHDIAYLGYCVDVIFSLPSLVIGTNDTVLRKPRLYGHKKSGIATVQHNSAFSLCFLIQ